MACLTLPLIRISNPFGCLFWSTHLNVLLIQNVGDIKGRSASRSVNGISAPDQLTVMCPNKTLAHYLHRLKYKKKGDEQQTNSVNHPCDSIHPTISANWTILTWKGDNSCNRKFGYRTRDWCFCRQRPDINFWTHISNRIIKYRPLACQLQKAGCLCLANQRTWVLISHWELRRSMRTPRTPLSTLDLRLWSEEASLGFIRNATLPISSKHLLRNSHRLRKWKKVELFYLMDPRSYAADSLTKTSFWAMMGKKTHSPSSKMSKNPYLSLIWAMFIITPRFL